MQTLFQFIMYFVFGKKWLLFDLKHGYKATLFINELELAMHKEKLSELRKARSSMVEELKKLQERPALQESEYIALLPEEQKESSKALYDIKKKIDGERAEEITTMKNRIAQVESDVATADGELQKGYMMTYKNRVKYDFIKNYKVGKTYGEE